MSLRNYSYKDVVMLMAAKTILQSMQANLGELSTARSNWTEAYLSELIQKIDLAIETFLGLDKKQSLREATELLNQIMKPALRDLSFLKTQIEVDFKNRADEILKTLGIDKNLKNMKQEALIEALYSFRKGMTDSLKSEITGKGANPALIETLVGYASQLQEANLNQEGLKSTTKEVSQEGIDTFNAIYDEVIGVSKIAAKYYEADKLKKEQFTFSKVVRRMGVAAKKAEEPVPK
ncbi:MAG TPA: hypothetical protein PLG33_02035 [Prolixibacteraceae bacterium]|nr:hypothetical protein [Prolixibacteraceae bacterium]HPR84799.1 hypothetical protein [Prolixibacteraceae bacterium]